PPYEYPATKSLRSASSYTARSCAFVSPASARPMTSAAARIALPPSRDLVTRYLDRGADYPTTPEALRTGVGSLRPPQGRSASPRLSPPRPTAAPPAAAPPPMPPPIPPPAPPRSPPRAAPSLPPPFPEDDG